MLPTRAGGLKEPLPTPTRHLLLVFGPAADALQIGAEIDIDGAVALAPGRRYDVQLTFWAPEASQEIANRTEFELWAGHTVGSGRLKQ